MGKYNVKQGRTSFPLKSHVIVAIIQPEVSENTELAKQILL